MQKLLIEALVVGIAMVVVGLVVSSVIAYAKDGKVFSMKEQMWMGLGLLLTGVVVHLGAEWSGVNKWYCENGNACQL